MIKTSEEIHKIIASGRAKKKLTQVALAKIMGVSVVTIVSWEKGYTIPAGDMLIKLARELDIVDDLFSQPDAGTQDNNNDTVSTVCDFNEIVGRCQLGENEEIDSLRETIERQNKKIGKLQSELFARESAYRFYVKENNDEYLSVSDPTTEKLQLENRLNNLERGLSEIIKRLAELDKNSAQIKTSLANIKVPKPKQVASDRENTPTPVCNGVDGEGK